MQIGEVAKKANIAASTLRYYEEIGLIKAPHRINGRRDYGEDIFVVIKIIKWAQALNFSLEEIRTLLHGAGSDGQFRHQRRQLTRQKLLEVEQMIEHFENVRLKLKEGIACTCTSLESCQQLG